MRDAFGCEGISTRQHNGPAGNQDVWHFHLHVFPRYPNDGLCGGKRRFTLQRRGLIWQPGFVLLCCSVSPQADLGCVYTSRRTKRLFKPNPFVEPLVGPGRRRGSVLSLRLGAE
jgi:hypothetical protein